MINRGELVIVVLIKWACVVMHLSCRRRIDCHSYAAVHFIVCCLVGHSRHLVLLIQRGGLLGLHRGSLDTLWSVLYRLIRSEALGVVWWCYLLLLLDAILTMLFWYLIHHWLTCIVVWVVNQGQLFHAWNELQLLLLLHIDLLLKLLSVLLN